MRIARRAERIEPFYVMEVAKAASELAAATRGSDRPMIFLNIGEPDFTAPPRVVEAAAQAHWQATGEETSLKSTCNTDQGAPYLPRAMISDRDARALEARSEELPRGVVPETL